MSSSSAPIWRSNRPFVVWLAHRDTKLSGQCFSIGGGRAAPVVLAEPPGVYREGETPEIWVGQEQALLALTPLSVPGSMLNEVALNIANLPEAAQAAFKKVDWGKPWTTAKKT